MKRRKIALIELLMMLMLTSCSGGITDGEYTTAVFCGLEGYGEIGRETALDPTAEIYIFSIRGKKQTFGIKTENDGYTLQNLLKVGYTYKIKTEHNFVTDLKEVSPLKLSDTVVKCTPGEKSLKNFLLASFEPLCTTLYVYGGGWDYQDAGSSVLARTIGVPGEWKKFYLENDANYRYRDEGDKANNTYPFGEYNLYYFAGLDCSGYVGRNVYQIMNTKSFEGEGYVMYASVMAKTFSDKGFGTFTHKLEKVRDLRPGDIVSISGHVFTIVGVCDDDSVVIIHSTVGPSTTGVTGGGVQLSSLSENGTKNCEAYRLATQYTEKYFPEWAKRYPVKSIDISGYLTFSDSKPSTGVFSWATGEGKTLSDDENYKSRSASEILRDIFGEAQ